MDDLPAPEVTPLRPKPRDQFMDVDILKVSTCPVERQQQAA
jgi:hypothetical protein